MNRNPDTAAKLAIKDYNDPISYGLEYIIDELETENLPASTDHQTIDWFGLHDLTV